MKNICAGICLFFCFVLGAQLPGAEKFAKLITAETLKEHLYIYASDEFEGRETGSEGQKKAVNYLRDFYIKHKINPGDLDKDYFQPMTLQIKRGNMGNVETENVVGIVKGSELPDEYLVITAHLDHVGYGRNGGSRGDITDQIHNGADDDGSGSVALLEIAKAFKKAEKRGKSPKRSVVFLHVTGEEKGLLGSKYYSENPIYPLENTVASLNIDMIGRIDPTRKSENRNYVYIIGSDHDSQDLHNLSEKTNAETMNIELDYRFNDKDDPNRFYYRSDHYNFAKNGIPIIFYFSGTHEDYHMPTDDPEKIEYDLLENRTRLIFHTAWNIANRDERIVVDPKEKEFEIEVDKLDNYSGTYGIENFPLELVVYTKNNKLFMDVMGQESFELKAVGVDTFKLEEAGVELKFNSNENSVNFKQGVFQRVLKKLK